MYMVVVCYGCGRFLLARGAQKTKMCPYCAVRLTLTKAKKVAYLETAREASDYIRELKGKMNR
jgi:hypothetical protein